MKCKYCGNEINKWEEFCDDVCEDHYRMAMEEWKQEAMEDDLLLSIEGLFHETNSNY